MIRVMLSLLLACFAPLAAAIAPLPFADHAEEARFQQIVQELRCLVCQNQNLADSDAGLASDLRKEVFEMMRGGRSDAQIREFMVERYGDFVLYRPPIKRTTWLLWFGPGLVLLLAAGAIVRIARRRSHALPVDAPGIEDLP